MKLTDLKEEDRPRERLVCLGPQALSDVELLAILIGSGTKEHTVLDIASQILKQHTLPEIKNLTYDQFIKFNGINKAKACLLLACFELAKRGSQRKVERKSLEDPSDIYDYIYKEIFLESTEVLIAILVDCKLRPLKKLIFRGDSTHQVGIPIKSIVLEALEGKAYGIILVHNHPSGDVNPSSADEMVTIEFQEILLSLELLLVDHLIVSDKEFYSMHEHGLLHKKMEYSVLGDSFEKNY